MDFFGEVFGTSASLFEGLNRVVGDGLSAQDWFATKKAEEAPIKLPWEASTPEELPYERQLREAVLLISQSPQVFLQDAPKEVSKLPADDFASAGAVLEADDGLRQLRFRLVPKYCSEEQFWSRYFAAVARVKEQVKAEQMWGDFDMLSEDEGHPQSGTAGTAGTAGSSQPRVELPSARQPTNATDTMSPMLLSEQSSRSAQDAQGGAEKGRQAPGQKAGPVRIQCKQSGLEPAAERMVMSGDLGSQASSITEALLMSPRSMSSTNTKGPLATPGALGGAPSTCPSHDSPASPFPLSPLSPAVSAESASHDARVGNSMSHDRTMSHAGPGRMSDARLGPELMQSGDMKVDAAKEEKCWEGPARGAFTHLHVPFRAITLQQLANAILTSKKALSMDEVGRPAGDSSTAGSSDRAATAAWRLFEPMQSAHPKAITSANQGLAESIATAMCEMTDCAEMALLWTEVMQEVDFHWRSGRSLPAQAALTAPHANPTTVETCFCSIGAALACRRHSVHDAQVIDVDIAQEGTRALDTLKELPPRLVFKDLFAVKAQTSLSAAAAAAGSAADNGVLLSGVSEVQQLTSAALGQPSLSKHQLTKLCQVFKKLEVMFQVSVEQHSLRQQTQQQAAWIATASRQDSHACSLSSSCSDGEDPTWSDLGFESWTLL